MVLSCSALFVLIFIQHTLKYGFSFYQCLPWGILRYTRDTLFLAVYVHTNCRIIICPAAMTCGIIYLGKILKKYDMSSKTQYLQGGRTNKHRCKQIVKSNRLFLITFYRANIYFLERLLNVCYSRTKAI